MAEEFVRKEHFDEFEKRMDERFDHANELAEQRHASINQRLADAEKSREENLVHISQRFDDLNQRFDDLKEGIDQRVGDLKESINQRFDSLEKHMDQFHADMRQMRGWLIWLFGLVVFGFLGSIVVIIFRDVFK